MIKSISLGRICLGALTTIFLGSCQQNSTENKNAGKETNANSFLNGVVTTIAGTEKGDYFGDGGPAKSAQFNQPYGIAFNSKGELFIADKDNNRIRKITTDQKIVTVAGTGHGGYSGDGGLAEKAEIWGPRAIAIDAQDNIYFADGSNHVVRKIDAKGIITTVAGSGNRGYSGDGGLSVKASLDVPVGIALDAVGNLYIAENVNNRVRKVDTQGVITTLAGDGEQSFAGDGGPAAISRLFSPGGVATSTDGTIYIADSWNKRIRKIDKGGVITTYAGNPDTQKWGHGGNAIDAALANPELLLIYKNDIYFTAVGSHAIRKIDSNGIIHLVAGTAQDSSGYRDGALEASLFNAPKGLAFDNAGNLFVADTYNNCIRKIEFKK
ncbi:MAG: hypothetical protein J0M08_01240 [Bacteroidetes bacterium]|nr:hypothetical protein [Bacteroidota bacterium]